LKITHTYVCLALISLILFSCSTKKDKALNRAFHRTTAKYNGYFNAKESLKEAIDKLETTYQEDYTSVLPTTILGDQRQAQKIYPQLNTVIEKASMVIEHHSMEFRGKEKNKWIDDNYFIMGQAMFYKQEYGKAIELFSYIINKHKGYVADLAQLWSARAYIEMGNFTSAKKQLERIEVEARLKKADKVLLAEVNANYELKKENWIEAIDFLQTALKYNKKKAKKTRITFIIAQLYQKAEDYESAYAYFDKVVKMNPEYDFLFNALLSRARAFNPKKNSSTALVEAIQKMLKDEKNNDYQDQIYFALAEIALKEEQREIAKSYLLNSTAANYGNDQQQSISHLTLADLYFEEASYLSAQGHYDTAMTFLSQNHPDYDLLSKKRTSLNELVNLYNTIELQDSLLTMSEMPEDALNSLIDEVIEEKKEEERQAKEAVRSNASMGGRLNDRNSFNPMSSGGGWYFYNPSAISFGFSEFITKWGERRLEDDWRRKNKSQLIINQDDEEGEEKDIYSREYYLNKIPFSDSAKAATIDLIVQSFYHLGLIYKEELNDYDEALEVFETLVEIYPQNSYEPLSFYQLYSTHKLLEENLAAQSYVQKLMALYPESDYLKMILDPESFYSEHTEHIDSALFFYEDIYDAFASSKHEYVIQQENYLKEKYKNHPIVEQLTLLSALSKGRLYGEEALVNSLNALLSQYYAGEVADEARLILEGITTKNTKEELEAEVKIFGYDPKEAHYFVLSVDNSNIDLGKVKRTVSDYNSKYYDVEAYKTQSLMLDLDYQLIIVKTFDKSREAMKYLNAIKEHTDLNVLLTFAEYEHFIISSTNFKAFYKDKSIDKYVVYFEDAYLKK